MRFRIAGTVRFFKGKVRGLANTLAGVTLGTCSDAMPGLREAAASCFDTLPEGKTQPEDVSKMLAEDDDSNSAPRGIRTHDSRFRRPVLCSAEL